MYGLTRLLAEAGNRQTGASATLTLLVLNMQQQQQQLWIQILYVSVQSLPTSMQGDCSPVHPVYLFILILRGSMIII